MKDSKEDNYHDHILDATRYAILAIRTVKAAKAAEKAIRELALSLRLQSAVRLARRMFGGVI